MISINLRDEPWETRSEPEPAASLLQAEAGGGAEAIQPAGERLPPRQFCVFRAGRERYGLSVLEVEEVVKWSAVTRVPLGPPFLVGISNLRGIIVPVVDIAFSEGLRPDAAPSHLIVAVAGGKSEQNALRIGLVADEVIGTHVTRDPLLTDGLPRQMPYCSGMLRHDGRLALILDLRRFAEAFPVATI